MKMILLFLLGLSSVSFVRSVNSWQVARQSVSGPECRLPPRQCQSVQRQIRSEHVKSGLTRNSHRFFSPSFRISAESSGVGQLIIFFNEVSQLEHFIFRSDHDPARRGVVRENNNATPGSSTSPSPCPPTRSEWSGATSRLQDRARPG